MRTKNGSPVKKLKPPPQQESDLRPVDKAFINSVMFDLGILPMESTKLDMNRPLKSISLDEARVIKRKFRKIWRKLMRKEIAKKVSAAHHIKDDAERKKHAQRGMNLKFGTGKQIPSRQDKLNRKRAVFESVWNSTIAPMIHKFENPERDVSLEVAQSEAVTR